MHAVGNERPQEVLLEVVCRTSQDTQATIVAAREGSHIPNTYLQNCTLRFSSVEGHSHSDCRPVNQVSDASLNRGVQLTTAANHFASTVLSMAFVAKKLPSFDTSKPVILSVWPSKTSGSFAMSNTV